MTKHIEIVCAKSKVVFELFGRITRTVWGLKYSTMVTLYKGVFLAIITYGHWEESYSLLQRHNQCPYLLSSETTAKETGLEKLTGKEDPVELESSLAL
ncbi:hypothetical protein ALC57_05537 [Trachymyrmex cornetzi]|uniref:Uncharacterized protein n=1 Tax=Trachymyrmex cornetzi TaxID=471704 RepID=A0A151JAL1_9HYME|nr:hypothetical protein ALC57_05537 [Trachymyrmex cornetzi]